MQRFFADLHIHIGRTTYGNPVKITAAKSLTINNILKVASESKGLDIIGVVDCGSFAVQRDIQELLDAFMARELPEGGIRFNNTTMILGSEVETTENLSVMGGKGAAHCLCYFPYLNQIQAFSKEMSRYIKNMDLSSQKSSLTMNQLIQLVDKHGGFVVPAHAFTPHKGVYGNVTDRLDKILAKEALNKVKVLELGLSADTQMADQVSELNNISFLTNSDAHSLPNIAREYNELLLKEPNYLEVKLALERSDGRNIVANYGMSPLLGKYYRSYCEQCEATIAGEPPQTKCATHGQSCITMGVYDRLVQIADQPTKSPDHRPPYIYQVPLKMLPKVGPKTIDRLLEVFGTEMTLLHDVDHQSICSVVGSNIADLICAMREGRLIVAEGGGGVYGKVQGME